jgi:hypothetical protein
MLTHAYSVYDRKGLIYNAPFFAVTDGSAVRSFQDLANDPQTSVGRHPMDYVLYRVGSFDDAAGLLIPNVPILHVADAASLVHPGTRDLFGDAHVGVVSKAVKSNG